MKAFSSLTDSLVIDMSYCNNLLNVVEYPVGSGKYIATFEVILYTIHNMTIFKKGWD